MRPGNATLLKDATIPHRKPAPCWLSAYFSPSWTAFQADGGRCFSVNVDDEGGAQVIF